MYQYHLLRALRLPLMAALVACGGDQGRQAESEHPSEVVTQWNDSTELFLEYPYPVAGQATGNWAIHLTDMKTFKPVTAGVLVVRFLQGASEVKRFTLESPSRDGIYLFDPVIGQPGTYDVQMVLNSPQVSSVHVLAGVRVWAASTDLPRGPEEERGIAFLKEQQWGIPFAVHPARERQVQRTVVVSGELIAPDGSLVRVSAPVSGIAAAVDNLTAPSVGKPVRAGQDLVVLNPVPGVGGYARTRGELERLEREAARAERLYAIGAIPQKRLEEVRHDVAIARVEMRAIGGEAADDNFRLRVTAPISGTIAQRSFVPGGRVEAGELLFTVVDASTIWLRAQLSAVAASSLTRDAQPVFSVEGIDHVFETTRLVSVADILDPRTRTIPTVFEAPNPGGILKLGQFVQATIPVGGVVTGVAIPNGAIVDDNGTPVVYVQTGGETFERRALTLGDRDARHTVIIQGVRPGDMVVTIGAYQVRLASLAGGDFAGGHAH